jgi:serine phosphatase RsbU (regulator of sigma subunit)
MVYIALDAKSESMEMVNAGHPPPLLVRDDGKAGFVEEGLSVPLGVPSVEERVATSIPFPSKTTLLLYTDGLVEVEEGLEAGLSRLAEAGSTTRETTGDFCDHVLNLMGRDGAADDVALLALRRTQ